MESSDQDASRTYAASHSPFDDVDADLFLISRPGALDTKGLHDKYPAEAFEEGDVRIILKVHSSVIRRASMTFSDMLDASSPDRTEEHAQPHKRKRDEQNQDSFLPKRTQATASDVIELEEEPTTLNDFLPFLYQQMDEFPRFEGMGWPRMLSLFQCSAKYQVPLLQFASCGWGEAKLPFGSNTRKGMSETHLADAGSPRHNIATLPQSQIVPTYATALELGRATLAKHIRSQARRADMKNVPKEIIERIPSRDLHKLVGHRVRWYSHLAITVLTRLSPSQ